MPRQDKGHTSTPQAWAVTSTTDKKGTAGSPAIKVGTGNTGFYQFDTNKIGVAINGSIANSCIYESGKLRGWNTQNPQINWVNASLSQVSFQPIQGYASGLSATGVHELCLVINGVDMFHYNVNGVEIKQGFSRTPSSQTANFTVTDTDKNMFLVDTALGNVTATLPTAADNTGKVLTFLKTTADANTVTVDGEGAETVNGAASTVLNNQYEKVTVYCDGTEWFIIG